ncbi:hypothetical protein [Actinomadura livida]|uniref:Uncharacterized protein n=1 Tax=Actinomadura livida TaxID=79909 RepID=A0A7W7MZX8_9ACTN|nr:MULTISPECIES: hypothetical protein [Actinomadura]MBB4777263.1 hypothetical protein [Actinomadura catellatispora]
MSLIKTGAVPRGGGDETTRRLCAAVYQDRELRNLVVNKVLVAFRHRAAPSYGFNLVPVADHAWRAWTLDAVQHVCILAVLGITAASSPPAAITALCILGLIPLAACAARLGPEICETKGRPPRAATCPSTGRSRRRRQPMRILRRSRRGD